MQTVEIYGTDTCRWCASARALLQKQGIAFVYRNMTKDPSLEEEFAARSNHALTVPQIFIGKIHVGGYSDLLMADLNGTLQQMIGGH
jgi:glutaredoxin 3